MNRIGTYIVLALVGLLLATSTQSHAGLTFFPGDPTGWDLAVTGAGHTIEVFETDPAHNISLSNEVELPPPDRSGLGTHILTFDKINTDLTGSFTFATQQAEQFLLYREQPTGDLFPFDRPDAVEMEVIDGSWVYALALEIFNLAVGTATVEVFSGETSLGSIPGDFNLNGPVDGVDLPIWETSFGAGAGADADSDNDSDGNDFLIWQQNFGVSLDGPAVAGVPEPASVVLYLAGMLSLIGAGRRGRKRFP